MGGDEAEGDDVKRTPDRWRISERQVPDVSRGKVPLSVKDPTAQDLLWEYAQRRRAVDAEFSDDLEAALRATGYKP